MGRAMRPIAIIMAVFSCLTSMALGQDSIPLPLDNEVVQAYTPIQDSIGTIEKPRKHGFLHSIGRGFSTFFRNFSEVDTDYVEPQHYNFTLMMQNTNTYEAYVIRTPENNKIKFSPQMTFKLGPYFGWRWVFLGYTFDLTHMSSNKRQELDLSIYSSQLGVDLFYRKTGNDYIIRNFTLGEDVDSKSLDGIDFNGVSASIKGFNLYYIFNHKKFSYPAAFSQSTVQRRSCGSAIAGIGYTRHSLKVDWSKLYNVVCEKLGKNVADQYLDSNLTFGTVEYTDVSLSGGYGYNWVFAHNWLLASSLAFAVGYKQTTGDVDHKGFSFRDFSLKNLNLDGVGRFGLVWNNTKWYYGASAIFHVYNYRKPQFSTSNIFGSFNLYIGFNFAKRKHS